MLLLLVSATLHVGQVEANTCGEALYERFGRLCGYRRGKRDLGESKYTIYVAMVTVHA